MPFYVVYAKTELGVPDQMAGIYIWAAVLAGAPLSLLWGHINDRRGPRAVLRGACALAIAPPLLAVLVPAAAHLAGGPFPAVERALPYLFAVVFLAGGSTRGSLWMGSNNYLYELATHEERHRYIALLNTLAAPRALFPLAIGLVLTLLPYRVVFLLLAALGAAAALVSQRMPRPSLPQPSAPEPVT